jgi:hypothetical protein
MRKQYKNSAKAKASTKASSSFDAKRPRDARGRFCKKKA